ncbi:MAG: DNA-directed RNA polymerase, subunit E'' [Thermoplasmata archaeon]|nr:DNA-directed RNA polymerase, subunit E'' [Thermoplasmata archaeon]
MYACKKCRYLTEQDVCPICGGEVSKDWQGLLIIVDYSRSKIAERLGITINGKYALRVR